VSDRQPLHVTYLHGFASSADSSKARFFAERLAPFGIHVERPDLNLPDFSTITVTRMVEQVEGTLAGIDRERVVLIGSSMGGLVAWHVAARSEARGRALDRLVLLAPALDFGPDAMRELGPQALGRWRDTGWIEYPHHAYGELRPLHYRFREDAAMYDASRASVSAPALVFQGGRDTVVDPVAIQRFTATRPTMSLRLLDDDHQLHASLEEIWHETAAFLGLHEVACHPDI
jgi:uncharacterized protein